MKILIQPVGKVENSVLLMLKESLETAFSIKCSISDTLDLTKESYNQSRDQYYSTGILSSMMNAVKTDSNRIIGATEVDLYPIR